MYSPSFRVEELGWRLVVPPAATGLYLVQCEPHVDRYLQHLLHFQSGLAYGFASAIF